MLTQDPSVRVTGQFLEKLHPDLRAEERIEVRCKTPGKDTLMRRRFCPSVREAAAFAVRLGETHEV